MKNLNEVLDEIFGPMSCPEKDKIIEAVEKDSKELSSGDNVAKILEMLNEIFGKKHRVLSPKVINRYKVILKHYTLDEIRNGMENAKNDDYHKETGYKHCHPEYFSRLEQMDKWVSFNPKQENKSGFQMPKMNL
jgi:hypothetical protein